MTPNDRFANQLPRTEKRERGRTDAAQTPLAIRGNVSLDAASRDRIRARLGRSLAKFAMAIERVTLRLDDVNGPRGGVDTACKIKIVLSGLPTLVVEERAAEADAAVQSAARVAVRAVRRELERRGRSVGPRRATSRSPAAEVGAAQPADEGSLIGRRVGRSRANLERALARPEKQRRDVYVDTSAPGRSASDRKVGYGATARRNTKRNTRGMAVALEDSRTTPSRKSTRKSSNRSRSSTPLETNASLQRLTPKAAALRAQAARRGRRSH